MKRILFTIFLVMGIGALTAQDSVNITFHVNMKQHTVAATGVYLAGGGTFGNPGDNEMTDPNADGVYSITVRLPKNITTDYTFTNGACGDWSCKENITGQSCAVAPFSDRRISNVSADTTILTCFQECTTDTICSTPPSAVNVTFRVDMTGQTFDSVYVTGGFSGWGGFAHKMSDSDNDNIWEATAAIDPGNIEYKFVINGTQYEEWDSVGTMGACIKDFGGFINRYASISGNGDTTFCVASWMGCCAAAALYSVEFSVDVNTLSPAPMAVNIGANWDGWSGAIAMDDSDMDGVWKATVMLPAGPIEYKFIPDGNWEVLDSINGQPCVHDFGGFVNRVDTISGNVALCTPIIGQCCAAAGINDILVDNNLFVLRPTQTSDFAYVDFPTLNGEVAQLQIINMVGQRVYREEMKTSTETHRIDVRSLTSGLYFVQVKVGNRIGTQKMIVD